MSNQIKRYPFSTAKHAHDIEFYYNRISNVMSDMESGEIPYEKERYNKLHDMKYGPLQDLMNNMYGACGRVIYLTGEQIGLAKKIVAWASNTRAETCIQNGRYDLIKYC